MDDWFYLIAYLGGIAIGFGIWYLMDTWHQNHIEGRNILDYREEKLVLQKIKLELRLNRIKKALEKLSETENGGR